MTVPTAPFRESRPRPVPVRRVVVSPWPRVGGVAVVFCSVVVFGASATGWFALRALSGGTSALSGSHAADGSVNILLIGLDTRRDQQGNPLPPQILDQLHAGDGDEGGYNTTTLILLHVPAGGGRATAFSVPRDDLVPIPGYRPDKIKQAYGVTKAAVQARMAAQGVTDRATLEQAGREAGRQATIGVVQTLTAGSEVLTAPGGEPAAALAASLLGGGVTTAVDPGLAPGLRVVRGSDYRPPAPAPAPSATGPSGPPISAGGVPCVD